MRCSAAFALALLCGWASVAASQPKDSLCVVLTENAELALIHVTAAGNRLSALAPLSGGDTRKEMNGNRLLADLTDTLRARFGRTERVNTLAAAKGRMCHVVLDLDLQAKAGISPYEEVSIDITGKFLDAQGVALDTVRGTARDAVPNPNAAPVINRAWNAVTALSAGRDAAANPNAGPPFNRVWIAALTAFAHGIDDSRPLSIARETPARPVATSVALALPPGQVRDFGAYHALVIGINDYRAVAPLKTAVNDAKTVAELLQKEYGFDTTLLVDATRNQILDAFDDLRRRLTEKDNLLIYYAGHGHLETDSDRGFWLPVDADPNRRANWLSNSDIADVVRATRAKHVLVVADSCYAGTLTRSLSVQLSGLDDLTRLAQKRARTALVSGGLEPVADEGGGGNHSVFARAFLDSLLANTGAVETSQIFSSMRRQVLTRASQTPQYGDIRQTGHEGGDFIFVRRK
jgi:hypothetical protein